MNWRRRSRQDGSARPFLSYRHSLHSRHPPPCGGEHGSGRASEASTELPAGRRRRQVADKMGSGGMRSDSGADRELPERRVKGRAHRRTPPPGQPDLFPAVRPIFLFSVKGTE
ncbi:hypothetical protein WJU16_00770 [Chitinophaga pollutisoli]|uniref:Uncharacterized protein n=1 Tax=Chitinophaga pollutisoli TaxID=3133966 RepID=A0ABZ2YRV0_9BACT